MILLGNGLRALKLEWSLKLRKKYISHKSLAAIAQKLAWDDHHMRWVVMFVL